MDKCGFGVTVAYDTSSIEEWFDSTQPLHLIPLRPSIANQFRKLHIKGFVKPGANNFYIGAISGKLLFGVLGLSNPDRGTYDLFLKADTTPSEWHKSTDLLLFMLRTKECKTMLEQRFARDIDTVYTKAFSVHHSISRYKKHAKLIKKEKTQYGYDLGYLFELGTIVSLKEAKSQFIQKSWKK